MMLQYHIVELLAKTEMKVCKQVMLSWIMVHEICTHTVNREETSPAFDKSSLDIEKILPMQQ